MLSPPEDIIAAGEPGSDLARLLSWSLGPPGAHGADEAEGVSRLRQRRDLDDVARVRGLDELPVADIDPLVLRAARARLEEEQVAGQERRRRDPCAFVELRARVVRQLDAELGVDVHSEARAVEAAERAGASPTIGNAEVLQRDPHRLDAGRPARRHPEERRLREPSVSAAGVDAVAGDPEREPRETHLALPVDRRHRRAGEAAEQLRARG